MSECVSFGISRGSIIVELVSLRVHANSGKEICPKIFVRIHGV